MTENGGPPSLLLYGKAAAFAKMTVDIFWQSCKIILHKMENEVKL
jgi:hypothetical protein